MLTGQHVGAGFARTSSGGAVGYRMIVPDKNAPNLKIIAGEGVRWRATVMRYRELSGAGKLSGDVYRRAMFAEEVLASIGEILRIGACCIIISESADGRILGAINFNIHSAKEGTLNLLVIDPIHFEGSPDKEQLRGIGTALVAVTSRQFLSKGVETVYLHPFDEAARKFWMGRGFAVCGAGGRLCLKGRQQINALIDGCEGAPTCDSEFLICGLSKHTEAMRLPQLR